MDKESDGDDDPDWVLSWRKDSATKTPLKSVDEVYDDKQEKKKRQSLNHARSRELHLVQNRLSRSW